MSPIFFFGSISSDLNVGLRALQQIRTLIPERLSEQGFSVVVDRKAFESSLDKLASNPQAEASSVMLARSKDYYSRWVMSGESVRIGDFYQQFEYSSYWCYPTAMHRLYDMYPATPVVKQP